MWICAKVCFEGYVRWRHLLPISGEWVNLAAGHSTDVFFIKSTYRPARVSYLSLRPAQLVAVPRPSEILHLLWTVTELPFILSKYSVLKTAEAVQCFV